MNYLSGIIQSINIRMEENKNATSCDFMENKRRKK